MPAYQPQPSAPMGQPRSGPVIIGVLVALAVLSVIAFLIAYALGGWGRRGPCGCTPVIDTSQVSSPTPS